MITGAVDLARLFLEGYQASHDRKFATLRIREAICRELRLNKELTAEAERIYKKEPDLANALLNRMQTQAFDALSMAGLPLSEIFSSPWSVFNLPDFAYRNRLENIR